MVEQLDLLTSSVVASPARTSARQDPAQVSTAHARACGSQCSESCERCSPLGSLLKTCLRSELAALTEFSTTWRRQTTPLGRSWWVLTTSEQRSDAKESGSSLDEWPTPTATPYGSSNNGCPGDGRETYATAGKPSLETMARPEWVTPTASLGSAGNRSRSGDRKGELLLAGQAMQGSWPTPHGMGNPDDPHGSELSMTVAVAEGTSTSERSAKRAGLWPTATAGDAKASGSRTTANSGAHPGISLTDAAVHGLSISDTATRQVWATPAAHEVRLGYQRRPEGMASLQNQQSLTTEVLDDAGLPPPEKGSTSGRPPELSPRLNANWVFQLMGYPETWARLSTTPDSRLREIQSFLTSSSASDECS